MSQKILFLTRLFHPHIGGVEKHVWELSKQLLQNGHQVSIITEQYEKSLPLYDTLQNIKIIRIPHQKLSTKISLWSEILRHRTLFFEADIVHVHDVGWWIYPLLPLVRHKFHITFHGWEGKYPPEQKAIAQRRALAYVAKSVIQVGAFIEQWYGTQPDLVTYGATEHFDPSPSSLTKKIAILGRLSQENCIDLVLQTCTQLKKANRNLNFTFIGDGPLRSECEAIGTVSGFVENPVKQYHDAVLVFASSYLSILEAQAHSKLVCAMYNHGLKKDYLQTHPTASSIVIADDPQEMAKQTLDVIDNPKETNQKIRKAYSWAKQQTWQKLASEYEAVWKVENREKKDSMC